MKPGTERVPAFAKGAKCCVVIPEENREHGGGFVLVEGKDGRYEVDISGLTGTVQKDGPDGEWLVDVAPGTPVPHALLRALKGSEKGCLGIPSAFLAKLVEDVEDVEDE